MLWCCYMSLLCFYNGFLCLLWNIISTDEGNFPFGGQSLAKTLDYKAIKLVGMVRPANLWRVILCMAFKKPLAKFFIASLWKFHNRHMTMLVCICVCQVLIKLWLLHFFDLLQVWVSCIVLGWAITICLCTCLYGVFRNKPPLNESSQDHWGQAQLWVMVDHAGCSHTLVLLLHPGQQYILSVN